jgi:hypothetical protein
LIELVINEAADGELFRGKVIRMEFQGVSYSEVIFYDNKPKVILLSISSNIAI